MLKNYSAISGQSIYDVCLKIGYSLDNLLKLLEDSYGDEFGVNDIPASGQQYIYDDALVVNQPITQAYNLSGTNYATYYGTNGSAMYLIRQNNPMIIPGPRPIINTPPNSDDMQTLVESASFVSGADGTTVITPADKNGGSLIGYAIIFVERETRPIKRANWVWNAISGILTLTSGETLDNGQELFYIYTKTI
jgi:hypothetical protein